MHWIALKHALLSHLPVASGLLLPFALIAAQRHGRSIRPWWTVSRYLGWTGFVGILGAFLSGFASGRLLELTPAHRILPPPAWGAGTDALLFRHALLGGASLLLAGVALWSMTRSRKEHESLGFLAMVLGFAWCAVLLMTGESGHRLAHGRSSIAAPALAPTQVSAAAPVQRAEADPEAKTPVRALDYAALEAINPEPVRSQAHGRRWIRAWVSPEAAAAYRAGQTLPQGALVVLSSLEDRWGRPGSDGGPLYALEMKASGPALTFYWPRIPTERRREFGGEARVYWRDGEAGLDACRTCHTTGMADPASRSWWRAPRRSGSVSRSGVAPGESGTPLPN